MLVYFFIASNPGRINVSHHDMQIINCNLEHLEMIRAYMLQDMYLLGLFKVQQVHIYNLN